MSVVCSNLPGLAVTVKAVRGACGRGLQLGQAMAVSDLVPEGLCPTLYHILVPYVEAVLVGAVFRRKPENCIDVRCSRPGTGTMVRVLGLGSGDCRVRLLHRPEDCPAQRAREGEWRFPGPDEPFCLAAFYALYPVLAAVAAKGGEGEAVCPGCPEGGVTLAVAACKSLGGFRID